MKVDIQNCILMTQVAGHVVESLCRKGWKNDPRGYYMYIIRCKGGSAWKSPTTGGS